MASSSRNHQPISRPSPAAPPSSSCPPPPCASRPWGRARRWPPPPPRSRSSWRPPSRTRPGSSSPGRSRAARGSRGGGRGRTGRRRRRSAGRRRRRSGCTGGRSGPRQSQSLRERATVYICHLKFASNTSSSFPQTGTVTKEASTDAHLKSHHCRRSGPSLDFPSSSLATEETIYPTILHRNFFFFHPPRSHNTAKKAINARHRGGDGGKGKI